MIGRAESNGHMAITMISNMIGSMKTDMLPLCGEAVKFDGNYIPQSESHTKMFTFPFLKDTRSLIQ